MKKAFALAAGAAVVGAVALSAAGIGATQERPGEAVIMRPGNALSLDFGSKHAVSYFTAEGENCALTVVVSTAETVTLGAESLGTRFNVKVSPGSAANIDAAGGKSAEFFCGPHAAKMSARMYERAAWSAKS